MNMADKEIEKNTNDIAGDIDEQIATDVASKSLADALRISFVILKVIIAVLVILFIASGIFRVQFDEQALVLHFGEIRGDEGEARVLKSGLHWAWPAPIDEIVIIPVTQKQVLDIDSFWYYLTLKEKETGVERRASGNLDPLFDGYCLTRNDSTPGQGTDYSIVHSKWKLTYTIDNVELFFRNIYYKAPGPGEDFLDVVSESLNPLLQSLVADAVVTTLVEFTIDEAIGHSEAISRGVGKRLQAKLDKLSSGIIVESILPQRITWPRQVDAVFDESNKASQTSRRLVTEARAYAEKKLNETGGVNAEYVLDEIDKPSITPERKEELFSMLAGSAQTKIAHARAYRTEVVESAKANAEYLMELLPEYKKSPEFVLQNIYLLMINDVMKNADEKIFLQDLDELRYLINRDPSIQKSKKADEQNSGTD